MGLQVVQQVRQHDSCDVIAVHDPDPEAAAQLAATTALGTVCRSFDELLMTGVDFVVLTGPLEHRSLQLRQCADQAVPALLHAPLAVDLPTAQAMHELAERQQLRVGVLVPGQDDPVIEQLRRMIAADWLGGVVCVQAIAGDDELLRTGRVRHDAGLFVAASSAHVHLTTWLTGRSAHSVTAQSAGSFHPDIDDSGVASLMLRGNISCSFIASRLTRADAFAIHGTDGGLRIAGDRIWLNGRRPFRGHVFDYETPGLEQVLSRDQLRQALAEHHGESELHGRFARWLEDIDDFPCPIEQAVLDFATIDAMQRAAREQRTIQL